MANKSSIENWSHIASIHAGNCNMYNMPARRGVYYDRVHDCLVVFSNNPYREEQWRVDELAALRATLVTRGWNELGIAYYPPDGEQPNYTYAMVIDASESELDELTSLYNAAVDLVFKDLPALHYPDPKEIEELIKRLSK